MMWICDGLVSVRNTRDSAKKNVIEAIPELSRTLEKYLDHVQPAATA